MGYEELRKLRERAGLTQQEAAAFLGIGYRTYQRWETGLNKRPINAVYIDKLKTAKRRGSR